MNSSASQFKCELLRVINTASTIYLQSCRVYLTGDFMAERSTIIETIPSFSLDDTEL